MATLVMHPTATAQWYELVSEAEATAQCALVEELESYLVFLLMRFANRPDLAGTPLALKYLHSVHATGRLQQEQLKDVGDQCLLLSGLFPRLAERKHVKISYFVDLGRVAYHQLSTLLRNSAAPLYAHLSQDFVPLMDVLQVIGRGNGNTPMELLPACDLWFDTGSRLAYETVRQAAPGALPVCDSDTLHLH